MENPIKKVNQKKKILIVGGSAFLFGLFTILGIEFFGYISIFGFFKNNKVKDSPKKIREIGPIVNMQPMTINLKDEDGRHYLRIKIALEVGDKKWIEEVQSKMSILNDIVIMMVCEKRLTDLKNLEFKNNLKKELLEEMNHYFQPGQLRQIFFEEFLYQ